MKSYCRKPIPLKKPDCMQDLGRKHWSLEVSVCDKKKIGKAAMLADPSVDIIK